MASSKSAKMALDDFQRIDPSGMYRWLVDFPAQVEEAVRIGTQMPFTLNANEISALVLTGMGGSAIGGDLLRSYLLDELRVPFIINRSYGLPAFVDHTTLVIVSSYSGYTEETLAAYRDALRRKASVLCITTGGETERLARKHGNLLIKVPSGLQPRAALGYSFFPLLVLLIRAGFVKPRPRDIRETISLLGSKSLLYSRPRSLGNLALKLAKGLHGKLPIIYSPADHLDAVNVRWRGQISENAKQLAFGHVLPEMNHNEIVGWKVDRKLMKRIAVIFLQDRGTHPRIRLRTAITQKIVHAYASDVIDVWSEGRSLLARIFSLIYLGDWMSYYLAILNRENPIPVKVIEYLKGELAKA